MTKYKHPVFTLPFDWRWLAPKFWGTWLTGGLIILLAFVPAKLRDRIAVAIANFLFERKFLKKRRAIADTNLSLCFPEMSSEQRVELMRKNTHIFVQLILGIGELTVRSTKHLHRRIRVEGEENVREILDNNEHFVVLLPHTYPVDYAGLYFASQGIPMCTMFKKSRNPVVDWAMLKQRTQYGGLIFERSAGLKALMKAIREGYGCIYLPDEDLGPDASIMTPFFAADKATIPVLGKVAKTTSAKVLPVYAGYDGEKHEVVLYIHPHIPNYPTGDIEQDTLLMNQEIEKLVQRSPEQYMWTLKLLKTMRGTDKRRY
ncbi:lauroyl-Kdo(2)-lipid IV(A) myristoyltransferase [Aliagarivorans marinus]|uniref:lauroyl-Kdo(2)-lipid IV(A) myristoyltransferase n=1 Tax=Aliagarivorans marinus TaxID=561965 RepID=UPI00041BBE9E|nr:lauroyl-Kdo(2)-lipid IV(A) myristoyltransferase [Aliagarivorans marinus]